MTALRHAGDDLRFGIFLGPFHPPSENPTLALERDLDLVAHIDRLGYDEAWFGEHHSGGFEISASPEVFIAFAANRSRRIRLGTGVSSLSYHHPYILADRMLQLDHLTRGRTMFGVGPGALPSDAFAMGLHPDQQRRRMQEALDALVPLLRGETVSMATDWFTLKDAKLQLAPYTRPMMEMAVASVRSPAGAMAAGRHGIGMLSIGGTSDESVAAQIENWRRCEEAAAEHGQAVDRRNWRIVTFLHIAETAAKARDNVMFGLPAFADYFAKVPPSALVPPGTKDPLDYVTGMRMAAVGTPDDAIAHIERLLDGTKGFGVVLEFATNWANWENTKTHYEMMARYVIPHFQGALAHRRGHFDAIAANRETYVPAANAAVADETARYEARRGGVTGAGAAQGDAAQWIPPAAGGSKAAE
jgi:limonene 1,2-monooxygenase